MAGTRRAILDAVGAELVESGIDGFSIQAVADRAGVTHRTVYNHFPTREALNDAFAEHVETVAAELGLAPKEVDTVENLPEVARLFHTAMGGEHAHLQVHLEAYVKMTMATGRAARVFRERSKKAEKLLDDELGLDPSNAKLVTSAIRMFISSAGWFFLKRHHGLAPADAGRMSEWAVRVLLDAARRGDLPNPVDKGNKGNKGTKGKKSQKKARKDA